MLHAPSAAGAGSSSRSRKPAAERRRRHRRALPERPRGGGYSGIVVGETPLLDLRFVVLLVALLLCICVESKDLTRGAPILDFCVVCFLDDEGEPSQPAQQT